MGSYAGTYGDDEWCRHERYWKNCPTCANPHALEAEKTGATHYNNGAGYCVGCPIVDGRCTVLVRHCPVINTPEQLFEAKREDAQDVVDRSVEKVAQLRKDLANAKAEQTTAELGLLAVLKEKP